MKQPKRCREFRYIKWISKWKNRTLSKLKSYDSASKNDDGTVKENTKYKDSESNIAVIPEGYKVSENENEKQYQRD